MSVSIFLFRRICQSIFIVFLMSIVVFISVYAIGNPVDVLISPDSTPDERLKIISELGLDKSLFDQYQIFVQNLFQGNLGISFVHNRPAILLIIERLPATLELTFCALLIAIVLGIPLGLLAGIYSDKVLSRWIMTTSVFFYSLPTFFVGILLIVFFCVHLNWLPTSGRGDTVIVLGHDFSFLTRDGLFHILLPAINLSLYPLALVIRLTATSTQETLPLDFIKFAKARGLNETRIIFVHLLKYILIPILTMIGLQFSVIFAFSVITERIFAWPGMGRLIIESITLLDRPVIVAYLMVTVTVFMIVNLVVDIFYCILDPRVRIENV